jgi:hypothetical protein
MSKRGEWASSVATYDKRGALDDREPTARLGTRIRHRLADAEHSGFEAPSREDSPQPADLGE